MDDPAASKQSTIILEALRQALADIAQHRLFKSGKVDGLFVSRSGAPGEAAAEAVREGYLEPVRTETKGKSATEWVRLTPKGIEYVYKHDSPRAVLEEMRALMHASRAAVPAWVSAVHSQLHGLAKTFAEEMNRYLYRLDALTERVEEALRRVEADIPDLAEPFRAIVPWGLHALTYLDHRRRSGKAEPCPLPELFAAVRDKQPHLSVPDFQQGLKRLADNRALQLLPFAGGIIPEPEHAIPDGARMLYHAIR
jgi:hypothetical protein